MSTVRRRIPLLVPALVLAARLAAGSGCFGPPEPGRYLWPDRERYEALLRRTDEVAPIRFVRGRLVVLPATDSGGSDLSESLVGLSVPPFRNGESVVAFPAGADFTGVRFRAPDLDESDVLLALFSRGGARVERQEVDESDPRSWKVERALDGLPAEPFLRAEVGSPIAVQVEGRVVVFVPSSVDAAEASASSAAFEEWAYATALLVSDQPLYEGSGSDPWSEGSWQLSVELGGRLDAAAEESTESGLRAAEAIAHIEVDSSSPVLGRAAEIAEAGERCDVARALRARYRPVGGCSMDTRPQEAARAYAELCSRTGDLSCFLNLQLRIMGDSFSRVAYSSYGEQSHGTDSLRLLETGIDVDRYLAGLAYRFDSDFRRPGIGTWRLARSIVELGAAERFDARLAADAEDPRLDAANRLRVTQVLVALRLQAVRSTDSSEPGADLAAVRATLLALRLHPFAAEWVGSLGKR